MNFNIKVTLNHLQIWFVSGMCHSRVSLFMKPHFFFRIQCMPTSFRGCSAICLNLHFWLQKLASHLGYCLKKKREPSVISSCEKATYQSSIFPECPSRKDKNMHSPGVKLYVCVWGGLGGVCVCVCKFDSIRNRHHYFI